jgi:hypothetical protein
LRDVLNRTNLWRCLTVAIVVIASGCRATLPSTLEPQPIPYEPKPCIVYVADGAGNFQMASKAFRLVAGTDHYPLEVRTFEWSHGKGRIVADQICYQYARQQGERFADELRACKASHPEMPIHVVGHSAGAMATLAALEAVPEGIVDHAVLLAPSVSSTYDLRPALQKVRVGLHVFYSENDLSYLGLWTSVLGNTDRKWTISSGLTGFRVVDDPERPESHQKLHQHAWHPNHLHLGNDGGHYGCYQPDFLRAKVLPLLCR